MGEVIPLRVAIRARPLIQKEKDEGCQQCLTFFPDLNQIVIGKDRNFTYDYVFKSDDEQIVVYENCVKPLVKHIFKGYNATVLAYGQTGSGKTFTMGGGYEASLKMDPEAMGVIPRILLDIFDGIKDKEDYEFTVKVSYLEIINEELQDLLTGTKNTSNLAIREENGLIKVTGLLEKRTGCVEETMRVLELGCSNRTTAATAMNNTSSRSHAIFTVSIEQRHKEDINDYWKAKLQLVDLAGSERIKKTHAEGERLKEGININKGLLSLGNVISALGDEQQKKAHIPYRDSKLTRILQDSLGGNSHTLMIACVSPADSNMEETLNTLRYADRAKKIKNKPVINWDPQTAEIMRQKEIIQNLKMQLVQAGISNFSDGTPSVAAAGELQKLQDAIKKLESQCNQLQADNDQLTMSLKKSFDIASASNERAVKLELKCSRLKNRLHEFEQNVGVDFDLLSSSVTADNNPLLAEQLEKLKTLASKVNESEETEELDGEDEDVNMDDVTEQKDVEEAITEEEREIYKEHTRKQAFLNQELQELNQGLQAKERIMTQTRSQIDQFDEFKKKYDSTKEELETKVNLLQKEKDELALALEDVKTKEACSKVSEQRRKRLQELEGQINSLRKQMADAKKVIKLKDISDQKVKQLNADILNMKKARVKLMKQLKEDAEAMRKYKQEKDKQVLQLQQRDRKRQFEIQKLQREKERTQNVLQRKSEEVAAANKRLKEALATQKKVLEDRTQKFEKCDSNNIGSRIKKVLSNELDIKVGVLDAKYHHGSLLTGRKELAEELKHIKEGGDDDGPPAKRFSWMDEEGHVHDTSIQEETRKQRIQELQQQLEIQNLQIADLQQRILDAEQETKGKSAKDSIHTMMEAKIAVKWLMEQAASYKAMNTKLQSEVGELKATCESLESGKYIDNLEADIDEMRRKHKATLLQMQEKHNDEIEVILTTMKVTASPELEKKCQEQEETIEKLTSCKEQLEDKCTQLEKHLTKYMYKDKSVALMPELTDDETAPEDVKSPFLSPRPKPIRRRKTDLFKQHTVVEKVEDNFSPPEIITEIESSIEKTGGSSILNSTFEVEPKEEDVDRPEPKPESKPDTNTVTAKPPLKLRKQRSGRTVLAQIQTDESVRSSDEFEKPKKLRKSSSTGTMKKKSSKTNLRTSDEAELSDDQPQTRYPMRKRSSTANLRSSTSPSEDDSQLLDEGGLKKRKLFNISKKPFFMPPQ